MIIAKKIRKTVKIYNEYLNQKEKVIKKLKSEKLKNTIRIIITKNNTKLALLNEKGEIKLSTTKGALKDFRGYERRLPIAAMTLSEQFGKQIRENKIKKNEKFHLLITGSKRKKRVILRG